MVEAIAQVQATWEAAALSQYYRIVIGSAPGSPTRRQQKASKRKMLAEGEETQLVGLMVPLLGLGDDANAGRCWTTVSELIAEGVLDYSTSASAPPTSFAALSPGERAKLLYALAEASLGVQTSTAGSSAQFTTADPEAMRAERLGVDAAGKVYWNLGDVRLYREVLAKPTKAEKEAEKAAEKKKEEKAAPAKGKGKGKKKKEEEVVVEWVMPAKTQPTGDCVVGGGRVDRCRMARSDEQAQEEGPGRGIAWRARRACGRDRGGGGKVAKEARKAELLAGPRRESGRNASREEKEREKAEEAAKRDHVRRCEDQVRAALKKIPAAMIDPRRVWLGWRKRARRARMARER